MRSNDRQSTSPSHTAGAAPIPSASSAAINAGKSSSPSGISAQVASATCAITGRTSLLDEPGAVLLDDLAVQLDPAAASEVLDQIPVERADVLPADVRIALPDRDVHRPGHLLVEEDVPHRPRDPGVAADPELADEAGAFVHVERRLQRAVAVLGASLLGASVAEREPDPVDGGAVQIGRDVDQDRSSGRVLHWREEELAGGHVHAPVVDLAEPVAYRERQVGVLADDPHAVGGVE